MLGDVGSRPKGLYQHPSMGMMKRVISLCDAAIEDFTASRVGNEVAVQNPSNAR